MTNPLIVNVDLIKAPSGAHQSLQLDISHLQWHGGVGAGPQGLSAVARDLLEIARLVWEIEKRTPKRISSDRVRTISVACSVREPRVWTARAVATLVEMLRLLGNVEWEFDFRARPKAVTTSLDDLVATWAGNSMRRASEVMLFSGGLDSTCGLAWMAEQKKTPALASFYGHKKKQRELAHAFDVDAHLQLKCQWSGGGTRFGGQFQYRSLLFLALAAALADGVGARRIYQFENGPLAAALPPSPIYRMTRHSHPRLHAAAGRLFRDIFGRTMTVENPFLHSTKREAVVILADQVGDPKKLRSILASTETCWNLNSRRVLGGGSKASGLACGFCIPCLVRRTAVPKNDPLPHRINFADRTDNTFNDQTARVHVDAYLGWARRMTSRNYSLQQFEFDLPRVTREALDHAPNLSAANLHSLYSRFAREIIDTFPSPGGKGA